MIDGKFYIGKDMHNNPKYLGSGLLLNRAIKKYGKSNFKKEVLEICENEKDLNIKEKYWIKKLKAISNGYNIAEGGFGGKTTTPKKIFQYDKNGNFIKEWNSASDVTKILNIDCSSILKNCKNKSSSVGGFIWSYNKINNLPKYNDNRTKKVLQYNKNGNFIKEWASVSQAEIELNIFKGGISHAINNVNKTCGDFVWISKNIMFDIPLKINVLEKFKLIKYRDSKPKSVLQYNKNGDFIKEWKSISEAARELNLYDSGISAALYEKTKTCGGFVWKIK